MIKLANCFSFNLYDHYNNILFILITIKNLTIGKLTYNYEEEVA